MATTVRKSRKLRVRSPVRTQPCALNGRCGALAEPAPDAPTRPRADVRLLRRAAVWRTTRGQWQALRERSDNGSPKSSTSELQGQVSTSHGIAHLVAVGEFMRVGSSGKHHGAMARRLVVKSVRFEGA